MSTVREKICQAIGGLSVSCSIFEVQEVLDPFFQESECIQEIGYHGEGITPLLYACDKGNVNCLEYLKSKYMENAYAAECIGDASYRSPELENTPLHHAAIVGCVQAISILCEMGSNSSSATTSSLTLGAARNSHGDTPLMMATASGHLDFCQYWHGLSIGGNHHHPSSLKEQARQIWELQNDSGDSCLSLACGQGWIDVVNFLLSPDCGVSINSDLIIECQKLYERTEFALKQQKRSKISQENRDRLEKVRQCLDIIQTKAIEDAEAVVSELMMDSETSTKKDTILPIDESKSIQSKKKRKPRKNQGNTSTNGRPTNDISRISTDDNEELSSTRTSPLGTSQLTILQDGTRAVRVDGIFLSDNGSSYPIGSTPSSTMARNEQQSVDEMFRNRCRQQQHDSGRNRISSEVDSAMKALCLDMSMLLYTPHGMAIDLSPSQLDVIEDILERQLQSVHEARRIQERLHNTPQPTNEFETIPDT